MSNRSEKTWRNDWRGDLLLWGGAVLVLLVILFLFSACTSTVRPKGVVEGQVSFDGTNQNSGVLSTVTNSQGQVWGAFITPHARDRYNALVDVYGDAFRPPLKYDDGVVPAVTGAGPAWFIDAEHLVEFMSMNRWSKSGKGPPPRQ